MNKLGELIWKIANGKAKLPKEVYVQTVTSRYFNGRLAVRDVKQVYENEKTNPLVKALILVDFLKPYNNIKDVIYNETKIFPAFSFKRIEGKDYGLLINANTGRVVRSNKTIEAIIRGINFDYHSPDLARKILRAVDTKDLNKSFKGMVWMNNMMLIYAETLRSIKTYFAEDDLERALYDSEDEEARRLAEDAMDVRNVDPEESLRKRKQRVLILKKHLKDHLRQLKGFNDFAYLAGILTKHERFIKALEKSVEQMDAALGGEILDESLISAYRRNHMNARSQKFQGAEPFIHKLVKLKYILLSAGDIGIKVGQDNIRPLTLDTPEAQAKFRQLHGLRMAPSIRVAIRFPDSRSERYIQTGSRSFKTIRDYWLDKYVPTAKNKKQTE